MTKLSEHHSSDYTKLLYIGDSSTGKTGSFASLVPDYDLRILDMDNGLDILQTIVKHECPDRLDSIDFETRRDKYTIGSMGAKIKGTPTAFTDVNKLLTTWSDETTPSEWGPKIFFILDSLTSLGTAAYNWAEGLNPGAKDKRQTFFTAQQALEKIVSLITSEEFKTNVIITSHVQVREEADGTMKGFPSSIGSALGPKLATYFNNLIMAESIGAGKNKARKIKTLSTNLVDLKTAAPFTIEATYPLETGLGDIVKALKAH